MRAVIFANGVLSQPETVRAVLRPGDLLIAADGGASHCRRLGLTPAYIIGDFDSLSPADLAALEAAGSELLRYPYRKDFTDLELALLLAQERGASEVLVLAALGARWDQTLANLLLPAAAQFTAPIALLDGPQEIRLLRSGANLELHGRPGDTVSLVPLGGDACGITTRDLEYPLNGECLQFGSTRGISNVMTGPTAGVRLESGLLLCVVIHQEAVT